MSSHDETRKTADAPTALDDNELKDISAGGLTRSGDVAGASGMKSTERLGNMEIQDLMSRYNQAEQLAGSVFKKKDDADTSIISKI